MTVNLNPGDPTETQAEDPRGQVATRQTGTHEKARQSVHPVKMGLPTALSHPIHRPRGFNASADAANRYPPSQP